MFGEVTITASTNGATLNTSGPAATGERYVYEFGKGDNAELIRKKIMEQATQELEYIVAEVIQTVKGKR